MRDDVVYVAREGRFVDVEDLSLPRRLLRAVTAPLRHLHRAVRKRRTARWCRAELRERTHEG